MAETTTIYVTKDAATKGIRKFEAHIDHDGWARCRDSKGAISMYGKLFAPASFRLSLAEATEDAERRRDKQVANLRAKANAMEAIDLSTAKEG